MQEMPIECNQNGGRDRNMKLQAATKFDCVSDRRNSESFGECPNGHQRQKDGLNGPIERDNDDQTTTFSMARVGMMVESSSDRDNGAEMTGYRRRLVAQSLMMELTGSSAESWRSFCDGTQVFQPDCSVRAFSSCESGTALWR